MNLSLDSNLYSLYGIDTKNVVNVSNKILKQSETQPQVQSIDYSKFNRATLGVDLYSSRTNVDLQRQIAMTQAGLYVQAVDVAKLNSNAAMNLYSAATVQKNVELTQSIGQYTELEAPQKLEPTTNVIQLFNIQDKNSNSSNGSNPFRSSDNEAAEEKTETDSLSLFA